MRRSTAIAITVFAVMLTLYAIESEARRPETLVIIALMAIGFLIEILFYPRTK